MSSRLWSRELLAVANAPASQGFAARIWTRSIASRTSKWLHDSTRGKRPIPSTPPSIQRAAATARSRAGLEHGAQDLEGSLRVRYWRAHEGRAPKVPALLADPGGIHSRCSARRPDADRSFLRRSEPSVLRPREGPRPFPNPPLRGARSRDPILERDDLEEQFRHTRVGQQLSGCRAGLGTRRGAPDVGSKRGAEQRLGIAGAGPEFQPYDGKPPSGRAQRQAQGVSDLRNLTAWQPSHPQGVS